MMKIIIEGVKATARPGAKRAELDLTDAQTRIVWGTDVTTTKGTYCMCPREYNLTMKGVKYASPRVQRALNPTTEVKTTTLALYLTEEAGNERCRFIMA